MGALDGKVAIVTGGTSGIGQRIVELFVEEGAKVVMAARREREGRAMADRLGISFIPTDVSNEADTKAVVDHAVLHFGQVDCLVNNAGIPSLMNRASEIDMADFDRVMAVNVRGMMLCTKYVAPVMLASAWGVAPSVARVLDSGGPASLGPTSPPPTVDPPQPAVSAAPSDTAPSAVAIFMKPGNLRRTAVAPCRARHTPTGAAAAPCYHGLQGRLRSVRRGDGRRTK